MLSVHTICTEYSSIQRCGDITRSIKHVHVPGTVNRNKCTICKRNRNVVKYGQTKSTNLGLKLNLIKIDKIFN